MEQEVLSHRKPVVEQPIEMSTLSAEPGTGSPSKSLEDATSAAVNVGITEDAAAVGGKKGKRDLRTKKQKAIEKIHFSALCWSIFLAGWNDGTTGPLLPRIQEVYHVNFTIVSLIFIFACLHKLTAKLQGFILGALANVHLTDRLGFGKTIIFGSVLQIVAYTLQSPAPPFPVFVMAFTINGFGIALQDAQANGFVANLQHHAEAKMGFLHAAYGAGALCSPLVSTQFAQLHRWSFHYLVSLGIAVSNTIVLSLVFGTKTQDECLALLGQEVTEKGEDEHTSFNQILRVKAVHFLAFFILVYVGVEVTIGGWIVTFMLDIRGGGPSSGYVSSGFFGGLMLGRILLLWVNRKVSLRIHRSVTRAHLGSAHRLELIVWLVPSLIGGAVAVSIVGLILGPMYPIAMNHAGRVLPKWLLTGSIGWIAGFGQAGSAAFPFITGAISSKHGIRSLQPLLIAMMGCMMLLWYLVPAKRRD
ncbi:Bypass of stop codon protein 6 [Leucoagaricus sp. SymC.cos]|nr:Bypass of stop codon protein 6 [Leucoagaricus sp. SymC.cos]